MTGGSVGSPAARAGGVVSRLGGGNGDIYRRLFFLSQRSIRPPRLIGPHDVGKACDVGGPPSFTSVTKGGCRSNPANWSKRGRSQIMTAHSLVVGNDMHPEYASVHCGYVHRLRFFFIDSVLMVNDGTDALVRTLADSRGWSPRIMGMASSDHDDDKIDPLRVYQHTWSVGHCHAHF
jgi:hypothetical protein